MSAEKTEESDKSSVTEQLSEAAEVAPLTRKRTRDDVEQEDNSEDAESSNVERKVAQVKRRKEKVEGTKPQSAESKDDDAVNVTKVEPKEDAKGESVTEEEKKLEHESTKEPKEEKAEKEEQKEEQKEEPTAEPKEEPVDESKEDSKEEVKEDLKEEQKQSEKPKFVFGSTTPFGANAFSLLDKKKNVFESSSESPKPSAPATSSVFGSNSKFGNAFQSAVTKKNIFDKTPEEQAKEKEDADRSKESTPSITGNLYKQVNLEKKDIKSGEEDEQQVFTCRAKLYALDLAKVSEGWKERGIGNVHVNKALNSSKTSRIIMRSIGLLKVILNTPLVLGLEVKKGMPSSLSSEKFIRITIVEEGKPMQYALKTGNPETTKDLFNAIDKLIPKDV